MPSTVSRGATVMAVPPSQLHGRDEVGLRTTDAGATTDPVLSGPAEAVCANGRVSTWPTGAACPEGVEPVTSPWPPKRVESALQPAAPIVISASAIARSHDNERNNSAKEFMSCPREHNNRSVT